MHASNMLAVPLGRFSSSPAAFGSFLHHSNHPVHGALFSFRPPRRLHLYLVISARSVASFLRPSSAVPTLSDNCNLLPFAANLCRYPARTCTCIGRAFPTFELTLEMLLNHRSAEGDSDRVLSKLKLMICNRMG